MYPILISWGNFYLPSWHVFFVLAAWGSFLCMTYFRNRFYPNELTLAHLNIIFVIGYIAGYFGARGFSILVEERPDSFVDGILGLFRLGPLTFYGGGIFASFLILLYGLIYKPTSWRILADILAPSALLGLAIGRIGCFLNGDDYGRAAQLHPGEPVPWWAVVFPNLEDGIPRIPVQLLESSIAVLGLILAALLYPQIKKRWGMGAVGFLCAGYYAVLRFFLEFYRDDFRGGELLGWSPSQIISIILFFTAGLFFTGQLQQNKTR